VSWLAALEAITMDELRGIGQIRRTEPANIKVNARAKIKSHIYQLNQPTTVIAEPWGMTLATIQAANSCCKATYCFALNLCLYPISKNNFS